MRVQGDVVELIVAFAVAIGIAIGGHRGGGVADPNLALAAVQGEHAAETESRSPTGLAWR